MTLLNVFPGTGNNVIPYMGLITTVITDVFVFKSDSFSDPLEVAWPSGLRRWFKAPVSSEARVRIPPLPVFCFLSWIRLVLYLTCENV